MIVTAPPEPFVPPKLRGRPVVGIAALHVGDVDRGADVVSPLRELGPAVDLVGPMPYTAFQASRLPRPARPLGRPLFTPAASTSAISAMPPSTPSSRAASS